MLFFCYRKYTGEKYISWICIINWVFILPFLGCWFQLSLKVAILIVEQFYLQVLASSSWLYHLCGFYSLTCIIMHLLHCMVTIDLFCFLHSSHVSTISFCAIVLYSSICLFFVSSTVAQLLFLFFLFPRFSLCHSQDQHSHFHKMCSFCHLFMFLSISLFYGFFNFSILKRKKTDFNITFWKNDILLRLQ